MELKVGVIGGSGLYELEKLQDVREESVETPYGNPSDSYILGNLDGVPMVFLPRHGRGHKYLPTEVPYRANIWGMKKLGVTHIISVSAVGSLQEEIEPGHIVCPDQFIDRTRGRIATFYGNGAVGHTAFADPITTELAQILHDTGKELGITMHMGGTYLCMEGPAFSTRAESHLYRSWGCSIIGMTNLTEAKLAREAEIAYATIALATDYDCWREEEEEVTSDAVMATMAKNVKNAKRIVEAVVPKIPVDESWKCFSAARFALVTDPKIMPEQTRKALEVIHGKYWK